MDIFRSLSATLLALPMSNSHRINNRSRGCSPPELIRHEPRAVCAFSGIYEFTVFSNKIGLEFVKERDYYVSSIDQL